MLTILENFLALSVSIVVVLVLFLVVNKRSNGQIKIIFLSTLVCLLIWSCGLLMQVVYSPIMNIAPIFFDYFVYIGACFLPIGMLFMGIIFAKTKIVYKKKHLMLFIIPITSLIVLWTNSYHHLFYEIYSINMSETIFGKYFLVHSLYTYGLILIGLLYLVRYSIKNSGFFSKQSILIIIGTLIPISINILGTFEIVNITIYATPISFSIGMMFYGIAIFKFHFLKVTPVALQKIVDRMSDAYIVVNEDLSIIDYNKPFLKLIDFLKIDVRSINIEKLINLIPDSGINIDVFINSIVSSRTTSETLVYEKHFSSVNKTFNIEISGIFDKVNFLRYSCSF